MTIDSTRTGSGRAEPPARIADPWGERARTPRFLSDDRRARTLHQVRWALARLRTSAPQLLVS
ncbi:hypothetical protein I4I73_18160 [Pseudonocardia sp. KRD-184]|uniref:Uncharacterized protein n=1 Tax=Pseudonocardia oceani TaxID=2792013 RepID=A0ABS6UI07_9PSEU|nr:hypothetical protein [Pseudonocardia oceani]MBW0091884.1 hypothetical protein [Pseudonocardia oceani]MBW0097906.1 hypothetical protein [Pseudonocardia oceani]MBW0109337.1 hypothetical protein [Pseudonocardia oceani]MBW0124517.1 hypothetical protein [Pseudonocardia oceani]MBW0131858.1 hypothetical protein [Pseudonocardia oceani]